MKGEIMNDEPREVSTEIMVPETTVQVSSKRDTAFSSEASFEVAQRMAKGLASSTLVPTIYQKNMPNCIIALNMAQRLEIDPLMVMQNMYVIHGKPSWSSQFLIACVNESGLFSALRYKFSGTEGRDDWGCVAWAIEKSTGERLESIKIDIAMAKAEGWYGKSGSKWKTIPALMMQYRSAAFFARTYCPQLTMGFSTKEEIIDIGDATVIGEPSPAIPSAMSDVAAKASKAVKKTAKKTKDAVKEKPVDTGDYDKRVKWLTDAEGVNPDAVNKVLGKMSIDDAAMDANKFEEIKKAVNAEMKG